ncbi:MAG: hypothetical protein LQ344_003624 [Seirophora lacunosa]|nr:MAG: hypothetical protein LQ344_003624 [Seirophora lacunosa]
MALSSIFLLGGFVVGVSIVRFTYIISLDLQSPDVTWNFVNVQIWTGVEIHVGIVCAPIACLPSLRPLLNLVLFGSVDRPCRKKGSKKESGGPDAKSQTLWNSHLRSYQSGSHGGVDGPRKTIGSHAFIRLPDVTRTPSHQSMTEVPGVEMRGVVKGDAIGVRTDVYVDSYV